MILQDITRAIVWCPFQILSTDFLANVESILPVDENVELFVHFWTINNLKKKNKALINM